MYCATGQRITKQRRREYKKKQALTRATAEKKYRKGGTLCGGVSVVATAANCELATAGQSLREGLGLSEVYASRISPERWLIENVVTAVKKKRLIHRAR